MAEKVKNIVIFLVVMLALILSGTMAWEKYGPKIPSNYDITPGPIVNAKADIIIEGPKEIKLGQLARLDVTKSAGKTFKWRVLPEGVDFEVYDDGRKVIFSSGAAGVYTFIVACANDNDVDVKVLIITVGEGGGSAPPVIPPVNPAAGLQGKIVSWATLVNSPNKKAEAAKLASSFASVQAEINSGQLDTIEEIISATKVANQSALGNSLVLWVPFLENLQKEMRANAESGLLVTPAQHAQMWGEIAVGLTVVSK